MKAIYLESEQPEVHTVCMAYGEVLDEVCSVQHQKRDVHATDKRVPIDSSESADHAFFEKN